MLESEGKAWQKESEQLSPGRRLAQLPEQLPRAQRSYGLAGPGDPEDLTSCPQQTSAVAILGL